jgi:hypothetical protein
VNYLVDDDPDFINFTWLTNRMRQLCSAPQWAKDAGGGCLNVKCLRSRPFEAGYCGWCC